MLNGRTDGYMDELVASRSIYSLDKGRHIGRSVETKRTMKKQGKRRRKKRRRRRRRGFAVVLDPVARYISRSFPRPRLRPWPGIHNRVTVYVTQRGEPSQSAMSDAAPWGKKHGISIETIDRQDTTGIYKP